MKKQNFLDLWEQFLKCLCKVGIHDLEEFHPGWIDNLPEVLQGMHWKFVCRRCGKGF